MWVSMPLIIKAKMTKDNFDKLIEEAKKEFRWDYLERTYKFDGTFFSMESCELDDFDIQSEAAMIVKYVESTARPIGLIYWGCGSYTVGYLHVNNGEPIFPTKAISIYCACSNIDIAKRNYRKAKKYFLRNIDK